MKLTKDEKDYLIQLKSSQGYKVLLMIEEEARNDFAKLMFKFDMDNPKHVKAVKHNQTYQKARDDLLKNIDSHTREVYTPVV